MSPILFVLDKEADDGHSFVRGFIEPFVRDFNSGSLIYFFAPKNKSLVLNEFAKYSRFRRRGVGRILHSFACLFEFRRLHRRTGAVANVFVRNEFLVLLNFVLMRFFSRVKFRIYFQSSYPHELYSGGEFSRFLARAILLFCIPRVQELFLVSENASNRFVRYGLLGHTRVRVIPLCCDFPIRERASISNFVESSDVRKFVYLGTVIAARRLDRFLIGFSGALEKIQGGKVQLEFVGSTLDEFLQQYPDSEAMVSRLMGLGVISFSGRVSRPEVVACLDRNHFGINYVPATEQFIESSSTKLGEYMSRGLPVISTTGVPYHEFVHGLGEIGWLCNGDEPLSISDAIVSAVRLNSASYNARVEACLDVASSDLRYKTHIYRFAEDELSSNPI